jgi:heme exporter protein B
MSKTNALPRRLGQLMQRELRIARRIGGAASVGVVFFLCLVALTPFAIGPDLALLGRIGPAILWMAALLATLLGLDRLFQADRDEGALDLLMMSDTPLEVIVMIKCLAHWLVTGLPLVIASPFFALMLGIDPSALGPIVASFLIGTPALTLIGAIGAALTVGLRRGGLLLAVLILPLSVPVLIFGTATAESASEGAAVSFVTPFLVLCALTLIALATAPFAAAVALRQSQD